MNPHHDELVAMVSRARLLLSMSGALLVAENLPVTGTVMLDAAKECEELLARVKAETTNSEVTP